jgi:hypothetical protein
VYATTQGIASSREVERRTKQDDAFRWICGGVGVTAHTLSDFRASRREDFDLLLTNSVAVLMHQELLDLSRLAQDGMRVRANAGTASFRRRKSLEECLDQTKEWVASLRALENDAAAATRSRANSLRAARERQKRIEEALRQLPALEALKEKNRRKGQDPEKCTARTSTTDPDARFMKMADGGIRPAYNAQFVTETKGRVIVGASVTNQGSDRAQMVPMLEQIQNRYGKLPTEYLVDGGFVSGEQIDVASARGVRVLAPVPKPRNQDRDPFEVTKRDSESVAEWRTRMKTDEAKDVYKERASTAECVNARARSCGLTQFPSRGLLNALSCALLVAIAHNCMRAISLGFS